MKKFILLFATLALISLGGGIAKSATITWANTNGGDWNIATNWSPNQVPASGDDVIITNSGTYSVTNAPSVTLDKLTLGGTNGIQTLTIASLTLTNIGLINSNGILNWAGGDLEGALTVAQGGTLTISNTVYFAQNNYSFGYTNTAVLTNYGTVVWQGTIYSAGNGSANPGGGIIYNAGLWQSVADNTIGTYTGNPTNFFINIGTLEKTGGTGISTINWNFVSTGTIDTPSGAFTLNWNGSSTLHGNLNLNGGAINAPLTVASSAVLNLSGNDLEGSLTVLSGGTLTISNTIYFAYNNYAQGYTNTAALTNYGTVIWAGTIYGAGNGSANPGGGIIYNAGLWQSVADNTIGTYTGNPNDLFINTGTLEKTGGTGASTINWNFLNNGGTVTTPTGSFSMGNWIGNGMVHGSATLSSGTISGTLASDAFMNFSATINGTLTVSSNAVANWSGGDLEGALTVAQGGTLTISNTVYFAQNNYSFGYTNTAVLTNYGTVVWQGTIYSAGNGKPIPNSGGAIIYNAGLWQSVADATISFYTGNPNALFINTGTLEKTGGTGISTINWNFVSTGTIDTPSGAFTLNWNGSSTLHGNLNLNGGAINAPLTIASNAVLNLSGNDLESALTILQGGTLTISNTIYFAFNNYAQGYTNTATLTNYGTVVWQGIIYGAGNGKPIPNSGGAIIYNAGLWQSVADTSISIYTGNPTNLFINVGTLEKIGGTGISYIYWNFLNNGGILGSQTNTLSLAGNYDLTGGTLNFGINSLTDFGKIQLSGSPAALTGSVSANLNNGYVPATGNSFPVLTYSSESGAFTNLISPFAIALGSSYGGATFTLTVLNVRPTLAAISPQNLNEQTTLNVNASATDPDSGQSLTYALVSGPGGLNVSSVGAISWMPNEAQGPSSNLVVVQVTDNGTPALSATNSFVVTVNEINVPPQLTVPADQNVNEQTALNVSASASDSDIPANPLVFALVSPPVGMTIDTNTGAISWMPTEAQGPGVYTVKVVVTDLNTNAINQQSFSVTNSFMVTVNEVNVAPVLTVPSDQTMNEQTPLNLFATATDSDIPANPLTFALVSGPSGLNVAANGNITWTPSEAQGPGVYTVFVKVSDFNSAAVNATSLSVTNSFQITVNEVNTAPVLGALNNFTVNPGQTVSFTATATDSDIPANTLTFSLVSPPSSATISGGGLFNWRLPVAFANSTNTVQVRVTDNGSPNLSDTKSFNVTVNPLASVVLTPISYSNSQFKVRISGATGPDYIIVGSSNLLQWSDLFTNLSPVTPFQFIDTNNNSLTKRFYRARLAP